MTTLGEISWNKKKKYIYILDSENHLKHSLQVLY